MDRHTLYELCVQSPDDLVPLLRAIHGRSPLVLGEDFCGTGRVSAAWVGQVAGGRAVAVDLDAEAASRVPPHGSIEAVVGDVLRDTDVQRHRADVIWVGNFSIGEHRTRADLLAYLRHARRRLLPAGVLVCDLYGGETAFLTGRVDRDLPLPDGREVLYTWEQREADPLTGHVVNAMHFEVRCGDSVEQRLRDAFVYRWRLWGVPELRDAMLEAGFASTTVYPRTPDAVDDEGRAWVDPLEDPVELEDSFDVLIACAAAPTANTPRTHHP